MCDRCGGFLPQNIDQHRYRLPWWLPYPPRSGFDAIAPLHRCGMPEADICEAWTKTVDIDLEIVYERFPIDLESAYERSPLDII